MSRLVPIVQRLALAGLLSAPLFAQGRPGSLGLFTHAADVGQPAIAGSTTFDAARGEYRMTGTGANIWAKDDQFQFAWREVTGDFTMTSTLRFLGEGNEHRKAGIMVRQSLDHDAAYADVVLHGVGMPSLQWRPRRGENTNTFDLPVEAPGTFTLKMVRAGVKTYLYAAREGAAPKEIAHTEVSLDGPVLVGLFVCAHDPAAAETVIFSNVSFQAGTPAATE
jgi:hypothetical protein